MHSLMSRGAGVLTVGLLLVVAAPPTSEARVVRFIVEEGTMSKNGLRTLQALGSDNVAGSISYLLGSVFAVSLRPKGLSRNSSLPGMRAEMWL